MAALESIFGLEILTKHGLQPTEEVLAGVDNIMIYFSAHWCPPCRSYTPQLSSAYSASDKAGSETVIIFVSSDRDENSFNDYYEDMSFYALPYSDRAKKEALAQKYDVRGIPTLVLLNGNGETVSGNIRGSHADYL